MDKGIDEIVSIADRFEVPIEKVIRPVLDGIEKGLSLQGCLANARLALALEKGTRELFSLDDAAALLNCTIEQVAANIEQLGITPMEMTTATGFEWLLKDYRPLPLPGGRGSEKHKK